jgi:hypothetical protein
MWMHHTVISVLSGSTIFFHIISKTAPFSKKNFIEYKMCILTYSTTFVRNICHSTKNWLWYDKKKCIFVFMWSTRLFLSYLSETWIFPVQLQKYSNIKFHENPSSGSRVVPCVQTDRHDKANSRFPSFASALKHRHSLLPRGKTQTHVPIQTPLLILRYRRKTCICLFKTQHRNNYRGRCKYVCNVHATRTGRVYAGQTRGQHCASALHCYSTTFRSAENMSFIFGAGKENFWKTVWCTFDVHATVHRRHSET